MSEQSWWVIHRNAAEASLSALFHKGQAYFQPVAQKFAHQIAPAVEQALLNAGKAVALAAQNGAIHGSEDLIEVAKASLKSEAPHLQATVTTALAANIVEAAAQAAAQAEDNVGQPSEK